MDPLKYWVKYEHGELDKADGETNDGNDEGKLNILCSSLSQLFKGSAEFRLICNVKGQEVNIV